MFKTLIIGSGSVHDGKTSSQQAIRGYHQMQIFDGLYVCTQPCVHPTFHDLQICVWSIFQCYHDVTERLLLHIACNIILCIRKMLHTEGQITFASTEEFALHLEFIVRPELRII